MIIQKVRDNQVTLIQGETGSGKTTQVPQIIFESRILPKKMVIGITQPRRVAAISLAMRVYSEVSTIVNNNEIDGHTRRQFSRLPSQI